ncbi:MULTISPECIES: sensor domain-containing diguanylate cyclase [Halomonadaceae]|jgi:two-component system, sensor histidine kinase LadS|uniref:sensor domain-containing diguanylate cyclase n=1 Tax=Halomonadaceae TaxID=28256 RepID=UPI00110DE3CA|nr:MULTISPECIES: diguanylate cyclase [Halomonas]UEQ05159.1 sensor domain-containing diguanylate cyclase [Halomonas profundus]TMU27195.1 GGDEF domain-containing protein [Halomonas sp. ATBC28]CAD5274744.1 Adenylyl cyclase class-3/4/guanylyl cyclase [Halomonas sp. 156]CAD5277228.1 Adenylyl cyclase class-3/4/guanylyl cyclase [Halomonas sp. 113]CAD5278642.1 Adenylyl cyclase class-3/4/guanylyl cyclase [Halomonas sp. 59]
MHAQRLTAGVYTGLLLLLAVCFMPWAQANTLLSASPSQASYSLAPYNEFWHADEQSVTLNDLLAQSRTFTPTHQAQDLNFGYTRGDVWLRTQVRNDSSEPQRWMVEFEYPFLDYVTLYTLRQQLRDVQQSGSAVPVEQRALAHRQAVFPLELAAFETVTLYTHVAASGSKMLNYNLLTPEVFYTQNDRHNFWLATYFGMLLAMGLYNLLLFFGLKERIFLHYSLFVAGFGLAILAFNGIGTLMFWSFLGENTSRLVALGFTFASTMATLFAQSFLNTETYCPRWHQVLNTFRSYCWLAVIASLLLPIPAALHLMDVTGFMAALLLLICGSYCSFRRIPSARLFVFAWSLFLLGAGVFALRNLGILPANFITLHGIQIGSALEMLLLSFALASRFNKLKRQKERAQAAMLAALKKQEAVLEQKVAARTKALEHLANGDMLTGLLNRHGLARCAAEALERNRQNGHRLALLMLDLDRFKPINDCYGHEAGDFVLQQIAKRIAHMARTGDHCARFGGDEFIIIMENIEPHDTLENIQARIDEAIRSPIKLPCGERVSVSVSIGVSTCQGTEGATLESLLREADSHMYAVKSRQAVEFYRYGSAS